MKIYDKKKFVFGMMSLLLGICLLVLGFLKGFNSTRIILMILLPIIGISEIYLGINQEAVKREKFEGTEERNRLISLSSKSKAFDVVQTINFALIFLFLILGKQSGEENFIAMGVSFSFIFAISRFVNFFSEIYYERNM
ncbi:hypothetical protein Ami103574_01720 [Aminipila butyrica]|uniref:DUF2178 domain-containing protein n=1 Tax=Aminipila butyrica TaxID=433296 RepID=A0A858BSM4_9FIRM|nr:hypothetical protein [Aminipila butyrica]QIB68105.1 hypothetical protein Ami103574_01720 [Aminipila butyrica]